MSGGSDVFPRRSFSSFTASRLPSTFWGQLLPPRFVISSSSATGSSHAGVEAHNNAKANTKCRFCHMRHREGTQCRRYCELCEVHHQYGHRLSSPGLRRRAAGRRRTLASAAAHLAPRGSPPTLDWGEPERAKASCTRAAGLRRSASTRTRLLVGDHLQARGDHLQTSWALPPSDGPCQHLIDLASIC